jgi:hypothetical protein
VVNALTGAAIGAGTKLLVDKITGKPIAGSGTTVPKAPAGGGAGNTAGGSKVPNAPAGGPKPPPAGDKKNPPTSVVKPPVGGGSLISADELYKGALADPSLGLPSGAIDNGDGTYTVGNTTYSMENDSVLYTTDEDGKISVGGNAATDEEVRLAQEDGLSAGETMMYDNGTTITALDDGKGGIMYVRGGYDKESGLGPKGGGTRGLGGTTAEETDNAVSNETTNEPEYFEDSLGNIYISTADGGYELYRAAEVDEEIYGQPSTSEDGYYDDGYGNIYTLNDSGEYELYRAAEVPEDILEEDYYLFNQDPTDYTEEFDVNDRYSSQEDDGDDYYDYRRGGLITMMKQGGVAKFDDGGYVDNGDGTYSIGRYTYDMMTDEYLYSTDSGNITNVSPDAIYSTTPEEDYYDTDSLGNIFKNGEFYRAAEISEDTTPISRSVSNVGSGGTNTKKDVYQTDAEGNVFKNGVFYRAADVPEAPTGGIGSDFLNTLTGALGTTAGAAGAGALIASLLGSDFGGGTGAQNQGVDMSQVGVINPRTTDFGIGPTNFVGYEDYGTSDGDYTPNAELLKNLNAPGYNPVNEGDYGYEEVEEEVPQMASGGLSSMATPVASYYTFGQPADILANLGMRAQPPMNPPEMMPQIGQQQSPQQTQQQGLPQQAPPQMAQQFPQGMPQQGMMPQQQGMPPPMRKGGLPHASNVPMVEGRMDFRKGSAVHGAGDGQSDDIPAMLADGEYVIDAETVAQIGNGSTKAGAQALDKFRESIRAHKRSAPVNKIPPKTKALTSYLKGAK